MDRDGVAVKHVDRHLEPSEEDDDDDAAWSTEREGGGVERSVGKRFAPGVGLRILRDNLRQRLVGAAANA